MKRCLLIYACTPTNASPPYGINTVMGLKKWFYYQWIRKYRFSISSKHKIIVVSLPRNEPWIKGFLCLLSVCLRLSRDFHMNRPDCIEASIMQIVKTQLSHHTCCRKTSSVIQSNFFFIALFFSSFISATSHTCTTTYKTNPISFLTPCFQAGSMKNLQANTVFKDSGLLCYYYYPAD